MHTKYDSIDILKFLLSILVVAIHTDPFNGLTFPFVRLAVPTFFILSGFFAFKKINTAETETEKRGILANIVKRYLLLYLFWFVVLSPLTFHIRQYHTMGFWRGLRVFIQNFIFTSTFQGSWYIMATMLGIIIVFVLSRKLNNKIVFAITIPFYLFATICSKYQVIFYNHPNLNMYYGWFKNLIGSPYFTFMISLIYIVIGKSIAERKKEKLTNRQSVLILILSIAVLLIEFFLEVDKSYFVRTCDCFFFLMPAATFLVLCCMRVKIECKHACYLRKMSTIIYCSHLVVVWVFDKLKNRFEIVDSYNVMRFTVVLVVSMCIAVVVIKLSKTKFLKILKYSY